MKLFYTIIIFVSVVWLSWCSKSLSNNMLYDNQTWSSDVVTSGDEQDVISTWYNLEIVWWWLEVPWDIAFVDEDTFYTTERWWDIYKFDQGESTKYFTIPDISPNEEAGLMGIAIDPDYDSNHHIYISYSTDKDIKIVRYTDDTEWVGAVETIGDDGTLTNIVDNGARLIDPYTILDMLPVAQYHAWWWVSFGPDGKLYISVGDAIERQKAQDLSTFHGKILRLNSDWSIPTDNPFSWSAVWSYGHRNVQWFDRDSKWDMYASEHGPSWFDGEWWWDEINIIRAWSNYWRPLVSHDEAQDWLVSTLITYTPAVAPASLVVYKWSMFPEWYDKILVGTLRWEKIIIFDPATNQQIRTLYEGEYGRIRNISVSPSGSIFFTTSNTDGRWDPQQNDDKIYRIYR